MTEPRIELFTYALSPFGMKVYWALIFKRIAFDLRYVNPRGHAEIAFTQQRTVPVLKVGDAWRLDSGPLCEWLDELFPDIKIAGRSDAERERIREADAWVTNAVIAVDFRRMIDPQARGVAFRNGFKLASIMRRTSGGVPWFAPFIWSRLLRRAGFIRRAAAMTDQSKSVVQLEQEAMEALERRLQPTGFIAGTDAPSYADLAAFAQLAVSMDLGLKGVLKPNASQTVDDWRRTLLDAMPATISPPLITGRPPFGRG